MWFLSFGFVFLEGLLVLHLVINTFIGLIILSRGLCCVSFPVRAFLGVTDLNFKLSFHAVLV